MIRINRLIGSPIWDSFFIPLVLLLPMANVFYCLALCAFVSTDRIKSIITTIFPLTHPPVFCDRTKIKPSQNRSPVVEIGVALKKLKNVIVSAVIKSNYLAFRLASHTNWLFIVH